MSIDNEIDNHLYAESMSEAMAEARVEQHKKQFSEFLDDNCNWDGTFCVYVDLAIGVNFPSYRELETWSYRDLEGNSISTDRVIKYNGKLIDDEHFHIHKDDVFKLVFEQGFTFSHNGESFDKEG